MESLQGPSQQGKIFLPGDTIAERFVVEKFMGVEIIGESYLAKDEKGSREVSITIIPQQFVKGVSIIEKIKSEIKTASGLLHKNVLTCYGMGTLSNGSIYIVTEYVEGQKLYSVLQKRRESNKAFSLRGASNLIVHLCNGLEEAHKFRIHGSLSPFSVRISSTGRVKIADFPLSRLYYMFPVMKKEIPQYVQRFWAPEIVKGSSLVTERADIYSLGVVLFELLTSTLPEEGNTSITAYREDLPSTIDEIVSCCLNSDPAERWNSVTALKTAILKVTEECEQKEMPQDTDDNLLLDLEIDIQKPMAAPPPPPPKKAPPHPPKKPPVSATPARAEDKIPAVTIPIEIETEGAKEVKEEVSDFRDEGADKKGLDLNEIISSIGDMEAEKWMITKDGLDHGPFRTREVVQMIVRWEVEGHHMIQNIETGIRVKLRESEDFKALVERAKIEKQRKEELEALAKSEKAEKRSGVAKIFIVLAVVGGISASVGLYFVTRAAVHHFTGAREVNLEEGVKIDIGKGGILDSDSRKYRGGRRKGGGSGPGGMSYEEYMAKGVEMGDLGHDGGQVQLSQGQINAVMSSQGKKLYPCIYAELKKNPSLSRVSLKFAIEGKTGEVMGVTVTSGGSSEFQSCISSKMKSIKFPTFSAPRMGASFYFDVGR